MQLAEFLLSVSKRVWTDVGVNTLIKLNNIRAELSALISWNTYE